MPLAAERRDVSGLTHQPEGNWPPVVGVQTAVIELIRPWAISTLVISSLGCSAQTPRPSLAQRVAQQCPDRSSDRYFFPEEALGREARDGDRWARHAISCYLRTIRANSLSCGDRPMEAYRFIQPSLDNSAVIVSLTRAITGWDLDAVVFMHPVTREPCIPLRTIREHLSDTDAHPLLTAIQRAHLWTVPGWRDGKGDDPTLWAIEARQEYAYRVVSRIGSASEPEIVQAARAFLHFGWRRSILSWGDLPPRVIR